MSKKEKILMKEVADLWVKLAEADNEFWWGVFCATLFWGAFYIALIIF